jgi:hypothetical protein
MAEFFTKRQGVAGSGGVYFLPWGARLTAFHMLQPALAEWWLLPHKGAMRMKGLMRP